MTSHLGGSPTTDHPNDHREPARGLEIPCSRTWGTRRSYWRQERPEPWLFPSRDKQGHLCAGAAKHLYAKAKKRAGIEKPGGLHVLRHTFATNLLEAGVGLHTLQRLLGHKSLRSTAHYLHLMRPAEEAAKSVPEPLDFLRR